MTGIRIEKNKRNGRKQDIHLKLARNQLALLKDLGEVSQGRPKGSGTKENLIKDYIAEHPKKKISEIAKVLGISRTTVYKYLNFPSNGSIARPLL